jgi:uncharacterized protein
MPMLSLVALLLGQPFETIEIGEPGPSFACTAAALSRTERMICVDPYLGALDLGVARFYASARHGGRTGRIEREQRAWLRTRDSCADRACLRAAFEGRLWELSAATGRDLPRYRDEDADASLVITGLGRGWYAFGAIGWWHGPTINSATASGVFLLQLGDHGEVAAATPEDCAFTFERLPRDRWRLTAHPPEAGGTCGGMNATVEGTYARAR